MYEKGEVIKHINNAPAIVKVELIELVMMWNRVEYFVTYFNNSSKSVLVSATQFKHGAQILYKSSFPHRHPFL